MSINIQTEKESTKPIKLDVPWDQHDHAAVTNTTAFYGHSLMFQHFSEILSYSSVLCLENLPYSLSGVCFSITVRMWFIHEEWNWLVGDKRLHTLSLIPADVLVLSFTK